MNSREESEQRVQQAEDEAQRKLAALCDELNTRVRNGGETEYKLINDSRHWKSGQKRIRLDLPTLRKNHNDFVEVYVDHVRKGWFTTGNVGTFYVRVNSSAWNLNHKRNWTFETKELAEKVHGKCLEFAKTIEDARKQEIIKEAGVASAKSFLTKHFGEHLDSVYERPGHNVEIRLRQDEHSYTRVEAKYNFDSKTFRIEGFPELTVEQFDKILDVVWKRKNG